MPVILHFLVFQRPICLGKSGPSWTSGLQPGDNVYHPAILLGGRGLWWHPGLKSHHRGGWEQWKHMKTPWKIVWVFRSHIRLQSSSGCHARVVSCPSGLSQGSSRIKRFGSQCSCSGSYVQMPQGLCFPAFPRQPLPNDLRDLSSEQIWPDHSPAFKSSTRGWLNLNSWARPERCLVILICWPCWLSCHSSPCHATLQPGMPLQSLCYVTEMPQICWALSLLQLCTRCSLCLECLSLLICPTNSHPSFKTQLWFCHLWEVFLDLLRRIKALSTPMYLLCICTH